MWVIRVESEGTKDQGRVDQLDGLYRVYRLDRLLAGCDDLHTANE